MNQYHIYEKIGKGKHSVVYKGRKKKNIQYHAIKSVDKSQKARVLQEVRTMHALDHKNILKFFAWYETTNHLWLILEYCVGGDLMSLLRQDVRLPESSIHDFARDMVVALQFLHANSIIYCDIKPSNILLDENGRLKLGGFGLSRRLSDINKNPVTNLPPAKRGTPCYMAPELFSEGATHSTASDLWSLGCVLYECATGRPPFMDSSFNQLAHDILHNDPAAIPGASPEFSHLLFRLLDKNPATRIKWAELVEHRFWQTRLSLLELPPEPALDAFIQLHGLAPSREDKAVASQLMRSIRESVDLTRLSRIALSNLEKEEGVSDYTAAQPAAAGGDITIDSADAELDFEEAQDDGTAEEDSTMPAAIDDSNLIDQSGRAAVSASDTAGAAAARWSAVLSLLWHPSDSAVKPIVANRRIERLPDLTWDAKSLPFEPLSLQQMLNRDQGELEAFLTHIYRTIASSAPVKDKVNVLSYFESLCSDTNAANVLINSSLTVLFVRMLRNGKTPLLRIRLASVLGLLVRHATYIADELAGTQLVEILTEALRDKSERVRRRVMATLGELLFYIATQQQDSGSASVQDTSSAWGITPATVAAVVRLLKPGEDEVCQHYAVKTIENICSQGGEWASKFAVQDTLVGLMGIYSSTKTENVKATAASTLSRMLRSSPGMLSGVLERWGRPLLLTGLADSSSKVQVAAVNILNQALSQPEAAPKLAGLLSQEQGLLPAAMGLLDHSLPLLRAKAVISIVLLCRLSPHWLLECCQQKLVLHMERLTRDKDTYTQDAVALLRQEMSGAVKHVCSGVADQLASLNSKRSSSSSGGASLEQLQVVLHLVTSPFFRPAVVDGQLVQMLAGFLLAVPADRPEGEAGSAAEFRNTLLHVLEALSQQPEHMTAFPESFLQHLMPALCSVISTTSSHSDTRFFCLRMMSDVLAIYLTDPDMYSAVLAQQQLLQPQQAALSRNSSSSSGGRLHEVTAVLDALLREHVVPLVPVLLEQEEPMPLYALKLLGGILEVNSGYVSVVESLQLSHCFFEFLTLEHPNNNVHNIRLCRQLMISGSLSHEQLLQLAAADKVCAVLLYAQQNNVEPFLEPVLQLADAMMARDASDMAAGASSGQLLHCFLGQLLCFMDLCTHPDAAVAVAASQCLSQLVALFPADTAGWLLSAEGAAALASSLQGVQLEGTAGPPPALQQHLLSALNTALATEQSAAPSLLDPAPLLAVLLSLAAGAEDAGVASAAAEAAERLGTMQGSM
ncbi:hypothetical protein OEZ85_014081 [Tetradesmus obliquus]|uniref:Protein kinase domain-containing protein n=1 Tax=Tetradesmus obliquus TaxID=3088 RepID=A0ABY8U963_TETOB|nr:hypothetical protein OEZ85_014081 [Tetradesmus obliquus]